MLDAYTIGIRIALNDDVTTGINSIRRELTALDTAIRGSAEGLGKLRELGHRVGVPENPELWGAIRDPRAAVPVVPIQVPEPKTETNEPRELTPRPQGGFTDINTYQTGASSLGRSRREATGLPRTDSAGSTAVMIPPPTDMPSIAPVSVTSSDHEHRPNEVKPSSATEHEVGFATFGRSIAPASLVTSDEVQIKPARDEHISVAFPEPVAPGTAGNPFRPRDLVGETSAPDSSDAQAYISVPAEPLSKFGSVRQDDAPARARGDHYAESAPQFAYRGTSERGTYLHSSVPETGSYSASAMPETETASDTGALYLDGARIGRWMFDRMAESVSRPNAGFTGPDPRLTATYPGAPFDS